MKPALFGSSHFMTFACALLLIHGTTRAEMPIAKVDIEVIRDVAYRDLYAGEDPAKHKERLDLYLPKGKTRYPVVVYLHGGAWVRGDNRGLLGVYSSFATALASEGIGVVLPNYRLSPTIKHPEHIRDVAKAVSWVHQHIAEYGGDPDQLFVGGHSAGGHLAALLATDEAYLKAEGLPVSTLKGVISVSGVYRIPDDLFIFTPIFGEDVETRRAASPVCHVRCGLPPFLLLCADDDLNLCGKCFAEEFRKALKDKQVEVDLIEVSQRNHVSVLFKARAEADPAGMAIRTFIRKHCTTAAAGS